MTARFSFARSAITMNIYPCLVPLTRKRTPIGLLTEESEFVRSVKNKNARHSVSIVNNFCAYPATVVFIRREHARSTRGRVLICLLKLSNPVRPRVHAQALGSEIRQEEWVLHRGKILLTLTISLKEVYISKKASRSRIRLHLTVWRTLDKPTIRRIAITQEDKASTWQLEGKLRVLNKEVEN